MPPSCRQRKLLPFVCVCVTEPAEPSVTQTLCQRHWRASVLTAQVGSRQVEHDGGGWGVDHIAARRLQPSRWHGLDDEWVMWASSRDAKNATTLPAEVARFLLPHVYRTALRSAMKTTLAMLGLATACCLPLRAPIRAPLRAPLHVPRRATLPLMNELQKEVETRRLFRRVGVGTGVALLSGGLGIGVVAGVLDRDIVVGALSTVGIAGSALFGAYTLSFEERGKPYSPVTPAESAPGMGQGLFATADIPKDTFMFDYEGERLTEPEMFERYPDGQGRYVACIGVTSYIDGVNEERSGLARWINHSRRRANVFWKKQRFGPSSPAMHFYTLRDIAAGEELFFDYGEAYWEAMGCEPID